MHGAKPIIRPVPNVDGFMVQWGEGGARVGDGGVGEGGITGGGMCKGRVGRAGMGEGRGVGKEGRYFVLLCCLPFMSAFMVTPSLNSSLPFTAPISY